MPVEVVRSASYPRLLGRPLVVISRISLALGPPLAISRTNLALGLALAVISLALPDGTCQRLVVPILAVHVTSVLLARAGPLEDLASRYWARLGRNHRCWYRSTGQGWADAAPGPTPLLSNRNTRTVVPNDQMSSTFGYMRDQ